LTADNGSKSSSSSSRKVVLRFEHPVTEGAGGHGGWMMSEAEAAAGGLGL
jgi:hypothetical protein